MWVSLTAVCVWWKQYYIHHNSLPLYIITLSLHFPFSPGVGLCLTASSLLCPPIMKTVSKQHQLTFFCCCIFPNGAKQTKQCSKRCCSVELKGTVLGAKSLQVCHYERHHVTRSHLTSVNAKTLVSAALT